MNKQEKLIVSAYTGVLLCKYEDFHRYAEYLVGRPIQTIEFKEDKIWNEIKLKVSADFMSLCESCE